MASGRPPALLVLCIAVVAMLALAHRDEIRSRAEAALGAGMPPREAALARGFVLGEDEAVDEPTVEDFRRSGLSHLLAVSGQNVALLALLALPLLAALGMPLRTRLVWVLAAIVVYVPLAGAGPSIVRAGTMGILTLLAQLAGRRASRLYGLAVAAVLALALDPGVAADVGWQLSFAAVLGILALARPLRRALGGPGGWRGSLAEGVAVTVAATLATAPLIAFHFGAVSTTTLFANVLALPAVAPAMWLGMMVSIGAQVPGFPAAVPNAVEAPLLAYIAQVAAWCGHPGWAYLHVRIGIGGLLASYAALIASALAAPLLLRRRRLVRLRSSRQPYPGQSSAATNGCNALRLPKRRNALHPRWLARALALSLVLVGALALWVSGTAGSSATPRPGVLRISVLDIGQGDAILLQPPHAPAVLVDGGPHGDGIEAKLRDAGVDSLGAAVVTHEQADHAGGIEDLLLDRFPLRQLVYARLSRRLRVEAAADRVAPARIAAGGALRSGALRLEALWPPGSLLTEPLGGADPNTQAVVLLARWRRFTMLLTADAEAGDVPLDPGPVDVLKLAHHGSEDPGLAALLDRTSPRLAVISVGADNSYGHPAPATLAELSRHRVPTLRTDRAGTIVIEAGRNSFAINAGGD